MSNYTKSTNFAAKDSLPSGNANKVVKGTEINTEFDNIATAIATKADLNSPTLVTPNLGTPSAAVLTNATGLPLTTGVTGTLPVANGGTGATTFSAGALLKGAGTSAITTATAGTDYAPATSGTSILKGNGTGGFSNAAAGTDYAAATTGTSSQLLANNGSGGFSNVTVGSGLSLSAGTLSTSGGASISAGDSNVTVSDTGSNGTVTVQTDGTERMRIDSSGNVGIGTSSPSQRLSVYGPSYGGPATSGTTQTNGAIRITAPGTTGILDIGIGVSGTNQWIQSCDSGNLGTSYNLLLNPNGGNVGIGTSSPTAYSGYATLALNGSSGGVFEFQRSGTQKARIGLDSATDTLLFVVDGSERMRIDSSGNVLVGKTSLSDSTAGIQLRTQGVYVVGCTSSGSEALMLNRNTSDGTIAIIKRGNTEVGTISVTGSATAYNTASPSGDGAQLNYQGITFRATQSASSDANTLDDYEEGTFTPTDASGAGLTLTTARGRYTKIGREVTCYIVVEFPSTASGSGVAIGGLPFTSANPYGSGDAGFGGSISYTNTSSTFSSFLAQNSTTATFYTNAGGAVVNSTFSTKQTQFILRYFT